MNRGRIPKKSEARPLPVQAQASAAARRRLPRAWWLAGIAAIGIAVAGGWWLLLPPHLSSAGGVDLGSLPRGVGPDAVNVLVITLDTTRADRLGCYGESSGATPNLDRLASEGVLFEHAVSPIPLTLPAHSSIFTGTDPPVHGVRDNGGYTLDPKHVTLAKWLKTRGTWNTAAFVAAFVLDGKWGLDQGFDKYFDDFDLSKYKSLSLGDVSRRGDEVVDAALPWLNAHANTRFFAWLHFYDPHSPYDAPEPYKSQYATRPYLGEIAFMDAQIGRVLQWLRDRGLDDRTIVVAIGDHGESLNEHGEGTHGLFVYDATLHVPLLIRAPFPAVRGRRVSSVVRSIDVMPTLLDLLRVPVPREVQGQSLVPLMAGTKTDLNLDAYSESYYSRFHYGWSELRALRSGRYKYIQAPRPELYDLQQDPLERRNVYDERRPLAERFDTQLRRLEGTDRSAAAAPGAIDPETRQRLAALGYIGSFVAAAPADRGTLADPKDKIDLFNALTAAREGAKGDEAIGRLLKVVATDPGIVDGWTLLGNEYFRREQFAQAIEYYKEALKRAPDYDVATINLANAYRRLGQADAALAGYERYLQRDPRNAYVHYEMGELYMDKGQKDRAAEHFSQALAIDSRVAAARNALGVIAFDRGDLDSAEREISASLKQNPDVRLAHYNLALIAERRGDQARAIAEYQQEMARHEGSYKAAFNLAKLYEQTGDRAGEVAAYKRAIEMNPKFAEGYFYLAKLYSDLGGRDAEAIDVATRGLQLSPGSSFAPLGHYVLADVYNRQGRAADASRELAAGRALEARQK